MQINPPDNYARQLILFVVDFSASWSSTHAKIPPLAALAPLMYISFEHSVNFQL